MNARDWRAPMHSIGRVVAVLLCALCAPAFAQESFPNRPIRIVVPFPAGGPTDILSRIVAQKMSEDFAQPVVVENRPGADTALGAVQVARATPDGYTLLAAMDTTLVMNPATKTSLPYDPFKDFAAISLGAKNTSLLTVRAEDGPKTIPELIALGKAKAGSMFNREAGIRAQLIPYKGSAEVVQGLLTGAVDYIVDGVASSLPLISSGKLRPLAKLNSRPLPQLPDVPPLSVAAGMPALDDMSSWIAFMAPAGTQRTIIDKLQAEIVRIYADPATADKLEKSGINAVSSTPEELDAFFRSEAVRWEKAFKESGIKLD